MNTMSYSVFNLTKIPCHKQAAATAAVAVVIVMKVVCRNLEQIILLIYKVNHQTKLAQIFPIKRLASSKLLM